MPEEENLGRLVIYWDFFDKETKRWSTREVANIEVSSLDEAEAMLIKLRELGFNK